MSIPVHSFWFRIRLVRADSQLFSLLLLGVMLGPAMFAVTLGYSVSKKDPLMYERRLLADREVEVNHLNTDRLLTCEL